MTIDTELKVAYFLAGLLVLFVAVILLIKAYKWFTNPYRKLRRSKNAKHGDMVRINHPRSGGTFRLDKGNPGMDFHHADTFQTNRHNGEPPKPIPMVDAPARVWTRSKEANETPDFLKDHPISQKAPLYMTPPDRSVSMRAFPTAGPTLNREPIRVQPMASPVRSSLRSSTPSRSRTSSFGSDGDFPSADYDFSPSRSSSSDDSRSCSRDDSTSSNNDSSGDSSDSGGGSCSSD